MVYCAGPYEKEVVGATTKEFHYIYGGDGLAAILKRQSGTDTMYYVHKDHLGSFDKITNSSGTVIDSASFDAWGRRRNPATWTYNNIPATKFSRGYTGHEHLDQFDLINMNGRMYDPILGRVLSSDPFVADPYFSQSFNRYSYVFNNPLKFTDPSGYMAFLDALRNLRNMPDGTTWTSDGNGEGHLNFGGSQSAAEAGALYVAAYGRGGYSVSSPKISISIEGETKLITGRGIHGHKWQWAHPHFNLNIDFSIIRTWCTEFPPSFGFNLEGEPTNASNDGNYTIEMNRIAESPNATVSEFNAYGPTPFQPVSGYILEPGGPSTTRRNQDRRIPAGTYNVTSYNSTKHPNVYQVSNAQVPADRFILIHIGNYHSDTSACLLPGNSYSIVSGNYVVWNSTDTINFLRSLFGTNNATLIIRDISPSIFNFNGN
jgi:RHS repeat-associated protein